MSYAIYPGGEAMVPTGAVARVERIWAGTSEIQRHIISRALLRPHES